MKKAAIIWIITVVIFSILFAVGKISDIGWLIWCIFGTLVGCVVGGEDEKKVVEEDVEDFFSKKEE